MTSLQHEAFLASGRDAFEATKCLLAAFDRIGVPKSMVDVGCGPGHLVKVAHTVGVDAHGIDSDVSLYDDHGWRDRLHVVDLRIVDSLHRFKGDGEYELVLCLEVAEHLPAEAADTLCDTLAGLVAPHGVLLFSAATPGQGGHGHLNEQPADYWTRKLAARGLLVSVSLTEALRADWARCAPNAWWYAKNLYALGRSS